MFLEILLSSPPPDAIMADGSFSSFPTYPVTAVALWVPHRWTLESAGNSVPLNPQVCLPADHGLIFLWLPLTQTPQPRPCSFSSFPVSLAFLPACTLWSAAVSTTYSFVLLTFCIRPWQGHGPEQVKPSLFSALVLQLCLIMEKITCQQSSSSLDSRSLQFPPDHLELTRN